MQKLEMLENEKPTIDYIKIGTTFQVKPGNGLFYSNGRFTVYTLTQCKGSCKSIGGCKYPTIVSYTYTDGTYQGKKFDRCAEDLVNAIVAGRIYILGAYR